MTIGRYRVPWRPFVAIEHARFIRFNNVTIFEGRRSSCIATPASAYSSRWPVCFVYLLVASGCNAFHFAAWRLGRHVRLALVRRLRVGNYGVGADECSGASLVAWRFAHASRDPTTRCRRYLRSDPCTRRRSRTTSRLLAVPPQSAAR